MSKAILIMDMPSSCEQCRLHSFVGRECDVVCHVKGTTQSYDDAYDGRPDWCPLKPMMEKQKHSCIDNEFQRGAKNGYNACIDEILGGSEE